MERYLQSMIARVNNDYELYLNCYSPFNRILISNPILVKREDKLYIGNIKSDVLVNVDEFEDIQVTKKDGYGGDFY